jgi:ATP-dependent DNA helicase PIF1
VHKSQGCTLSRAELQLNNAFDCGQVYVALSRLQGIEGLWLTKPLTVRAIHVHPAVLKFYGYTSAHDGL